MKWSQYTLGAILLVLVIVGGTTLIATKTSLLDSLKKSSELTVLGNNATSDHGLPSPLSFSDNIATGVTHITHGRAEVGDLANGWGTYRISVIRVTDNNVYLQICPPEVKGYMLFGVCPRRIYQVNLTTNELRNTVSGNRGNLDMAEDISADETWVAAGRSDPDSSVGPITVVVQEIIGERKYEFPVMNGFNQMGDVRFSPDGRSIAYAAALGTPGTEAGAIFMIDIASGVQTEVAKSTRPNSYLRITGWKDAATVDYKEINL